jgi:hypothetical protein
MGWGDIGTPMGLACERCGCERHDIVNAFGEVIRRSYVYPENYRYPPREAPSIKEMRLGLISAIQETRRARKKAAGA